MKTLEEDKDPDAPIVKGIVAELDHASRPLNRGQVNAIRAKLTGDELTFSPEIVPLLVRESIQVKPL